MAIGKAKVIALLVVGAILAVFVHAHMVGVEMNKRHSYVSEFIAVRSGLKPEQMLVKIQADLDPNADLGEVIVGPPKSTEVIQANRGPVRTTLLGLFRQTVSFKVFYDETGRYMSHDVKIEVSGP